MCNYYIPTKILSEHLKAGLIAQDFNLRTQEEEFKDNLVDKVSSRIVLNNPNRRERGTSSTYFQYQE